MLRAVRRTERLARWQAVNFDFGLIAKSPLALKPQFSYKLVSSFCTHGPPNGEKKPAPITDFNIEPEVESKQSKMEMVVGGLKSAGKSIKDAVMNPKATWASIKHEINHYWMGSKLLGSEIKITKDILARVVQGHAMTRRERKQLLRTTTDIFRLVPFAIFVIVPFMELALPLFLKFFPNMLPSTFQDSLKKEELMKKELQMRLSVAKFMQETLQELARKNKTGEEEGDKQMAGKEIVDFIHKTQQGQPVPTDTVLRIARLFRDDLTLDNISRPQLVSLCTYMGLQSYGSDNLLRFVLRSKIRKIKEDDRRILWEGVDSLNTLELREACRERGMRSLGLTQFQLKHQLTEWLELSTHQNVPISLLIMSRALTLSHAHELPTQVLRSSLSSLDSDTINEVVIASTKGTEEDSIDMRKRKLDSLKFQQEMIDEERATDADAKAAHEAPALPALGAVDTETVGIASSAGISLPAVAEASAEPSSALAPVPEVKPAAPKKKELTLVEMQALVDLARGSSLQREKSEFTVLQSTIESLIGGHAPARAPTDPHAPAPTEAVHADDERLGRSVNRMRAALNNMIKKLEVKIDTTEKAVGDKFNVLDKDGDGHLTAHELREAIVQLMRREFSLQEADQLVDVLDDDKDGKVSLVELLHYIEQQRESLEMQALAAPAPAEDLLAETPAGTRQVGKDSAQ